MVERVKKTTIAERIVEMQTAYTTDEANVLLAKGWRIYGLPNWSEELRSLVMVFVRLEDE